MMLLGHRKIKLAILATVLLILSSQTTILYALNLNPQSSGLQSVYAPTDWANWAKTAWNYFQPGVGVNSNTGLDQSTLANPCATDWSEASYIYSVIFARKLNLIGDTGTWQFNDRISKVLNFLSTRTLSSDGYTPYWAYDWDTTVCPGINGQPTNPTDSGRLLGALNALRLFSPGYASQINSIYLRSKPAYDHFSTYGFLADYYGYLVAQGYAAWGYDESKIFNGVNSYSGSYLTVYGQSLPELNTLSEPFNLEILEGTPSTAFLDFANRNYLAQKGRWTATGSLTAWSEGVYLPGVYYVYEWVLTTIDGSPQTWVLNLDRKGSQLASTYPPFAYAKVAFSYLAIYGENPYTLALVGAVKNLASSNGFGEAVFENGTSLLPGDFSSVPNQFYDDETNEQVLAAAFRVTGALTTQTLITGVDAGSGSVGPNCPSPSGCSEVVGSSVTVTASPSSGWQFSSWSTQNGVSCSSNPCTFNMPNNAVTLRATFIQVTQTLTTKVTSGSSLVSPTCPSGCIIAFNPASAQAGSNVQVSGVGFSSSDSSCNLFGSSVASQTCSMSGGTLTGSFIVADVTSGSYTVTATGSPVGDSGSATFTVTSSALTITVNPVSASVGSTVQVYGSGFSSSDSTCSLSDGGSIDSETCSIIDGSITASFIVANVQASSYTITVIGDPVGDSASAVFTVTGSPPSIALNSTSGHSGATVQVSGSSFPSSDSSCSLSGSVVSSPSCSISSGTLSGSFVVANVTAGSYTVTAIGSPSGDSGSATFSVSVPLTSQTTSSTSRTTITSQSEATTVAPPTVVVITSVVTTVVSSPTRTASTISSSISVTGPMILPPVPGFPMESIITGIILGLTFLAIVRRRRKETLIK
jgi:hypothetical protein